MAARRGLSSHEDLSAYRVFNGRADGVEGLVVEKFGRVLVVQLHEGRLELALDEVRAIVERIHRRLGTRAVYKKTFVQDRGHVCAGIGEAHRQAEPWIGDPVEPEQIITEHGLRFVIRPYDGFSVGLFLEHRGNRQRIRELAPGRRVLNAFAYTCGFSVAAAAGGARSVASVDLAKRFLEWGKRNFAVNGVDLGNHRFFCSDIFDFYKRARRRGWRYDLIILDPPTFSRLRRGKRIFALEQHLGRLLTGAIDVLAPGGFIFLATNDRRITRARLEEELAASTQARGRQSTIVARPELPVDFAGDPDYSKSVIARLD